MGKLWYFHSCSLSGEQSNIQVMVTVAMAAIKGNGGPLLMCGVAFSPGVRWSRDYLGPVAMATSGADTNSATLFRAVVLNLSNVLTL